MEDAFVLQDCDAVAHLFHPGGVLVGGAGRPDARGHNEISRAAARLWGQPVGYLAQPRRVVQSESTALVVSGGAINVARRGHDGLWRFTVLLLVNRLPREPG